MKVGKHYPIGQVCKLTDLPHSTIRFWEKTFSGLRPSRSSGGHRYYSDKQVELVKLIKKLLYDDGLTIDGAKKHMANARLAPDIKPELLPIDHELDAERIPLDAGMKLRIKAELQAILDILK